ncbi:dormancy-associated protein homolog 3-like [Dendrobium catenatum]|uniref:dormancy-associated protein homolog 3-like n=1 Tax=Dendrobium catenatum TaxID=906689 RepID=UPI0009F41073|nr:dormancy-associated protein homolog 3-like [Dendrobium catenatum]
MSLQNHPWDDTVAGPRPDSGTLRRFSYYSTADPVGISVTRSITILRPTAGCEQPFLASGPDSPLTPRTPEGDSRRPLRRTVAEPRNPTVFDWVVISALDR